MVKMNISLDNDMLQQLQMALAQLGAGSMPITANAMMNSATVVRDTWKGFAMGGSLPGITESLKKPNGGYARSIKIERKGPFDYEVYSESEAAHWIEDGTERLDMKTTHPYGPRSRITKTGPNKGKPYLIVPIRWGTPRAIGFRNIMPQQIYNVVKNKKTFAQTKTRVSANNGEKTPNARGEMVGRAQYSDVSGKKAWGDTLSADMADGVTDNMVGMTSMLGQDGKAAGYLTFRIISAASPESSWIKPAVRARPVTRAVAAVTEETINTIVDEAIKGDLGL